MPSLKPLLTEMLPTFDASTRNQYTKIDLPTSFFGLRIEIFLCWQRRFLWISVIRSRLLLLIEVSPRAVNNTQSNTYIGLENLVSGTLRNTIQPDPN
jgi:hypothetical protein